MSYSAIDVQKLKQESNPTSELLTMWGHHNHTILELFALLSKIQHYKAMTILVPFVDSKYHKLLRQGEGNLEHAFGGQNDNTKELKIGSQNFNKNVPSKIINKAEKLFISEGSLSSLASEPEAKYEELEKATNGWSTENILGKGGFGIVYKGKYRDLYLVLN